MPKCDFKKVAWAAASVTVSLQNNLDEASKKFFSGTVLNLSNFELKAQNKF